MYHATKNTKEIGVSGFFQFNNDNPYSLALSYGTFTSPTLEVGGIGSVAGAKGTDTATTIGGFVDYYFRGTEAVESVTALVPYAGLFAGYASQGSTNNASLGAQVGVKYFFNPNVALTGEVQYRSIRHGDNNTQLVLGLSTFFR